MRVAQHEAYSVLHADGLVDKKTGRGTYVGSPPTERQTAETADPAAAAIISLELYATLPHRPFNEILSGYGAKVGNSPGLRVPNPRRGEGVSRSCLKA